MPAAASAASNGLPDPVILPRSRHPISRSLIDPDAVRILYRLHNEGYKAYLVGGSVRDLLLGRTPKDFDIGTDARPGQIHRLFRNSMIIGKRFKLVHVRFPRNKIIEVTTFRRAPTLDELDKYGAENTFGTPRQDALRRDFTVNALFYNIADFSIIDYVGGLADAENRTLRVVGDPDLRYREDPVRMLRALEFSVRLGFAIDPPSEAAISRQAPLIPNASRMRMKEEIINLFSLGISSPVLRKSSDLGLFAPMMPGAQPSEQLWRVLAALDAQAEAGKIPETWFILSALHLPSIRENISWNGGQSLAESLESIDVALKTFSEYYSLGADTRRQAREVIHGMWRIGRGRGKRGEIRFIRGDIYRLATAFFRLWITATGLDADVLDTWDPEFDRQPDPGRPRRRRRRGRRRSSPRSGPGTVQPEQNNDFPDTSVKSFS